MDINFIAAWGEFLGGIAGVIAALGVIVTLLYLSRQVRQNTEQVRAQVAHGVMTALRTQSDAVKHSIDTADLYSRALGGVDGLTDAERFQFNVINGGFLRVYEEAYLHHQAGRLEDAYWKSLSGQLKIAVGVIGIRQDWDSMDDSFDSEFRKFVDQLRDESSGERSTSSTVE